MGFLKSRVGFIRENYRRRVIRFVSHLTFSNSIWLHKSPKWYFWPIDLLIYIFDLFLVTDLIDVVWNGHKVKRNLTTIEINKALEIFKDEIILDNIYVIEDCHPIKKNLFCAFVSFNTIQCIKKIPDYVLIHELVHVWQFQRFGSVYILRALLAQYSESGYDYQGTIGLMDNLKSPLGLLNFNFEQQAQIIEDYYKLTTNKYESLGNRKIYEYFVNQLQYSSSSNVA